MLLGSFANQCHAATNVPLVNSWALVGGKPSIFSGSFLGECMITKKTCILLNPWKWPRFYLSEATMIYYVPNRPIWDLISVHAHRTGFVSVNELLAIRDLFGNVQTEETWRILSILTLGPVMWSKLISVGKDFATWRSNGKFPKRFSLLRSFSFSSMVMLHYIPRPNIP